MNGDYLTSRFGRCGLLLVALAAIAQGQPNIAQPVGNSAVDLSDYRTIYINPAALAFQDPFFQAGVRVLHVGADASNFAYRQTFVSIATPETQFNRFGAGLRGQFLNLPVVSGGGAQAVASYKFFDNFALGASVGFLAQSLDKSQFDEQAQRDPFLAKLGSKFIADLGLGGIWKVNRFLTLGMGLNHLTRPNIAYGAAESRLPLEWHVGGVVGMGFFRAIVNISRQEQRLLPLVAVESFRPDLGLLKLGFGSDLISFEGQIHVKRGVNLSYRYEYPLNDLRLASSGSHEIGLVFNFMRRASLQSPDWIKEDFVQKDTTDYRKVFVAESAFDTLLIIDKHIKRTIDTLITRQELAELPEAILVSSDSLEPNLSFIGAGLMISKLGGLNGANGHADKHQDSLEIMNALKVNHSEHYLDELRQLAMRLKQDPTFHTRIVVPSDMTRAKLLLAYMSLFVNLTDRLEIAMRDRDYLSGKLGSKNIPSEVFYRTLNVAADTFKFHIRSPKLRMRIISWSLMIEDARGSIFHSYSGNSNQIPVRYVWDWRVSNGQIISPGNYYYYIRWSAEDGKTYVSEKYPLTVNQIDRKIAIAISKSNKLTSPDPGGKAMIILN